MKIIGFKKAVEIIKNGGVVIVPTDTVYGLICDATNRKAVEKIFKIKKRPKAKPLPLFVRDLEMAKELAEINKEQEKFLKSVWPGKVTAVLKIKTQNKKQKTTSQNLKVYGVSKTTIALRIPKYRLLLDLMKQLNRPLAQTSANISGQPASNNIKDILKQFALRRGSVIVRRQTSNKAKPSKIIDLTVIPYKTLRP